MTYQDHPTRDDIGHYLIRRVRNGSAIPMRLFLGRVGGLYCEVGGEGVALRNAPWPPRERITEAEYHYRLRMRNWEREQGIGDREPMDAKKLPPIF